MNNHKTLVYVQFDKTKKVYLGVYDQTSRLICPQLLSPEEIRAKYVSFDGAFYALSSDSGHYERYKIQLSDIKLDKCYIYSSSDYGFLCSGEGLESKKILVNPIAPWDESEDIFDGIIEGKCPTWVSEFLAKYDD